MYTLLFRSICKFQFQFFTFPQTGNRPSISISIPMNRSPFLKKIVIDRRAAYSRYWRSLIDRYIIWRYWYCVPFMRNNSARIIQYASLGRFTQRSSIELSTNLSRSREPRYINISAGVIKGLNLFNYAPLYDQLASNWWIMLYI